MNPMLTTNFSIDRENSTIHVNRDFAAPADMVWAAWTDSQILDQWWAPRPWRTETKAMDFSEGGRWHYAMIGPQEETHWCLLDYITITPGRSFSGVDAFCDSDGNINAELPRSTWNNTFTDKGASTAVDITIQFRSLEDLEAIVAMGFKEGFAMGMSNLDAFLSAQFRLRRDYKKSNTPRVSTYLNFAGNTEEAMTFYRDVFRTEFVGGTIQRFGAIEPPPGAPPMSEEDKNLVLHAEIELFGGHILMATDAPESMGFILTRGNTMHINVEPPSREEADRLFNELSAGGTVTMPMQDMFWGAYYGSFTDRYGTNWMLNYQQR